MAHAVTTQVLEYGPKFTIIKVNIKGDSGTATELVKAILFNASDYSTKVADKLFDIEFCFNGFSAALFWDANTDVPLISIPTDHPYNYSFVMLGGLKNNAGTGVTGDILISTTGLASTSKDGHIILRMSWE
jgi:hypothetical protein